MTYSNSLQSRKAAIIWDCDNEQGCHQDNPASLSRQISSVTKTLQAQGYKTITLTQAYQVAQQVAAQPPDILLIYVPPSGNSGYELCTKLRQQAVTHHFPIIFVGSRAEKSERIKVLRCGGNDYLQLPISAEECWLRLQQPLDAADLVRRLQADKMRLSQKMSEYGQLLTQQEQLKLSLTKENRTLHKLAFVDALTQVANRRGFNKTLVQRWKEAYENRQPLSLLLCDIDYFKRYNDTYGHIEGDRCLRAVADALVQGTHRIQDQVSRYGGEEFAIILPNTQPNGAQRVALSVQSAIARAQIPHKGSLIKGFVSLSIGIFSLIPTSAGQPYETLVHGADEALYTAKLWGRDRSVTNTASGLLSVTENCCLYDYTKAFKGFESLPNAVSSRAEIDITPQAPENFSLNATPNLSHLLGQNVS